MGRPVHTASIADVNGHNWIIRKAVTCCMNCGCPRHPEEPTDTRHNEPCQGPTRLDADSMTGTPWK